MSRKTSFVPVAAGLAALAVGAISGCADDPAFQLARRRPSHLILPLSGAYDVTAEAPFWGAITARFIAMPTDSGFAARSRARIAWDMVGGVAGVLGPVFTPSVFPSGVILLWTSDLPHDGAAGEGWIGIAGMPSLGARTRMTSVNEPVEILFKGNRRVALLKIAPVAPGRAPATDYAALAESIGATMGRELFDPEAAQSGGVHAYRRRIREVAGMAGDDAEFVFGAVLAARAYLSFSLPVMVRRGDPRLAATFAAWPDRERGTVGVTFPPSGPAVLKADAFLDPADTERVMQSIAERQPPGLLIDVRTCPGVTLASLLVLSHLVEEPVEAGVFVGPAQRADVLAGRTEYLPTVNVKGAASIAELEATLQRYGAARVIVQPADQRFLGPACVLTARRTSTSTEPLVWLLQDSGRATTVGQTTAGRPLVSRPIDVGQGWNLWLAAYDYVPPRGPDSRFNGRGVKPQVVTRDPYGEARRLLPQGG